MSAVYLPPGSLAEGARVRLPSDEAHHLKVRRASDAERVRLLDGAGTVALGQLDDGADGWHAVVEHVTQVPEPPPLIVAVGAGDRERFALVVEKATEFGATDVVAVSTERSRSVAGRVRPDHLERLVGRAVAALKQSGGAWLPRVRGPMAFEEALELGNACQRWLASASDEHVAPSGVSGPLAVLVGPEGGFTSAERDAALLTGWEPVRLARGTLRFETAAIAALALASAARAALATEGSP